jgi:hypothetical protein
VPNTFTKIASVTVGAGGAATIDFSSIPSTYTDLCLLTSLRSNDANDYAGLRFNNDTSSYTSRQIFGTGSSAGSTSRTDFYMTGVMTVPANTASTFNSTSLYIPNYTAAVNKSVSRDSVSETNATAALMELEAILWSNTAVINRITLVHPSSTFVQYSTATLYGIKNS